MLQARSQDLRGEIKAWERAVFERTGAKPTRKDIAADSSIGKILMAVIRENVKLIAATTESKYKEYESIRQLIEPKKESKPSRKRRAAKEHEETTPRKRISHIVLTPRKEKHQDENTRPDERVDSAYEASDPPTADTPASVRSIVIGPTPQKNGIPMGIFDNIPSELLTATPTRARMALSSLDPNGNASVTVMRTPSKNVTGTPEFDRSKFSRTPMSTGKRFMLDQFITPRKRKMNDQQQKTPSSLDRLFATPAFFKRYTDPLSTLKEDPDSPELFKRRVGLFKKPFGRTLSSMIKDMRKQEDDHLDAEEDILRQLEHGDDTPKQTRPKVEFADITPAKPVDGNMPVLDNDGFVPEDVLAELETIDAQEAAEAENSGVPQRIYKKKGLKRQTKRSNLRPVRNRAHLKTSVPEIEHSEEEDDEPKTNSERVPETQLDDAADDDDLDEAFNLEAHGGQAETEDATIKKKMPNKLKKEPPKKKGPDRANYRRLKIKSKNGGGKPGGRFGRRR